MVGHYGISLAVRLVADHFGNPVSKVCDSLLRHGTLSLAEIVRFTELSTSQVKNCLLVLVQHNCVQAFSVPRSAGGPAGAMKTVTQYMALFDNILHRMRFSKFLAIVKADLGAECEILLDVLLRHGRLTFLKLHETVASRLSKTAASKGVSSSSVRQRLIANFNKLLQQRYIERCPKPEPFIAPSEEMTVSARRRSVKAREEIFSVEKHAMVAATLSDAERFCGISDAGLESTDHNSDLSAGDKRKHEDLEKDQDVDTTITENEILWRVNFDKFICSLKKKACVANISSRLGADSGALLEVMIESSGQEKGKEMNYVTSTMDMILEGLRTKPAGLSMTLDHVRSILDLLKCRSSSSNSESLYSIDLKDILGACRIDEMELHIKAKYGDMAYRIFRCLIEKGLPLETDQIVEKVLIGKKDVQGLLYKLWKDEYLKMEKVIAQGTGRSGQDNYFLWKINKDGILELHLNDMHHATLNLRLKIAHILEKGFEFLQDREKRAWDVLEASLLNLDDAIMLFHDF